MLLDGFSLYTDSTIRNAAKYAYDHYLGIPYKEVNQESTPANIGGITVYRQTHGLSHVLRTMTYSETIVEEAQKAKLRGETLQTFADGRSLADVTPDELKKIMVAQVFFVTGREGQGSDPESLKKYHELSRKAFLNYIEVNKSTLIPDVFKDQAEINFYADIIEDKDHNETASPAHMLINQCHMIDSMREIQPPESNIEHFFSELQPWIGSKGAEAFFAKQRQFFQATYEVVFGFDSTNNEPHLVFPGLGRYVIGGDGNPIRESSQEGEMQGKLKFFPQDYKLQENERFMRVDEYLKLDEVQHRFPSRGEKLAGGMADLNEYQYMQRLNSREKGLCETSVDFCLGQLKTANHKAKIEPIKNALQSAAGKRRREPNVDEIAAARIIQQIIANPDFVHEDHVLLNGKKLEEQFFRDLLLKCDMAIVGSLLNDTDIHNIDTFMQHERNTKFHATGENPIPRNIGEEWVKLRRTGAGDIKQDLIFLMQNDSWYYSRVNAIAQNRDKGSTFKEVLISTLMTPLTSKSLSDTSHVTPPKTLFRGLDLPDEFKNKLIHQSETIIANTTGYLFTNPSAEIFNQIKLNDSSQMFANTCLSTSINIEVPRIVFDSNTIFEILDPDGFLEAKQVGRHEEGSETEFSIYLPEDVGLIPINVAKDDKTSAGNERHIITFIAVKSPDFIPQHESGYALEPYLEMQISKLDTVIDDVEMQTAESFLRDPYDQAILSLERQIRLPVRGYWEQASQFLRSVHDGKISPELKAFYESTVLPIIKECRTAIEENNLTKMQTALAKFPSDKEWGKFRDESILTIKPEIDQLRKNLQKKIVLQNEILPALEQCKRSLDSQDISKALDALDKLPSETRLESINALQLKSISRELKENLQPLRNAVITPIITDPEKIKIRYNSLLAETTKQIALIEKENIEDLSDLGNIILNLNFCSESIQTLEAEKIKYGHAIKPIDVSDLNALKARLQLINQNLIQTVIDIARNNLEQIKGASEFHTHEKQVKNCLDILNNLEKTLDGSEAAVKQKSDIEQLRGALIDKQKEHAEIFPLQQRSMALIAQLQNISILNHEQLHQNRRAQLHQNDLSKAQQLDLRFKEQVSARFKAEFNNDNANIDQLIAFLEKQTPSTLKEELGISEQNAQQLHDLLKILVQPTSVKGEIEHRIEAIDKLSSAIGLNPVKLEPLPPISVAHNEEEELRSWSFKL
ncbi:TPA: NAD-dependent ubiquitin ligase [Legionella pneumophila]|uniref:NAD-dependent ubiquitin ligase n=1 Tax=Legionella pneumophila TaxID=446 RepID=A0AAN5KU44_LEGPN|nr:NAD-dependent ubiquitin ligase [Legionella pneumophila]HAT1973543.1 NAD-dependent ubiquitin ligase [Legionella pneumophila]HBC0465892.1 NAD-dependent ubiquitin ligase [Legionella pneumophila]HDP0036788.1 NAD-dependent ubiquitin ligase [Legionella pneumophila]